MRRHPNVTSASHSTRNSIPTRHLHQQPPSTLPSILHNCARTVTCMHRNHHQHPKQRPKQDPKIAPQTARPLAALAPDRQSCKDPPALQSAPQTGPQTGLQNSTPSCTPLSTSLLLSQIKFPSLLEVRTPIAFSYLGTNSPKRPNDQLSAR